MNSTDTKPGYGVAVISAMLLSGAASSSCDFDTDDADGPDFLDKIIECEKQQSSRDNSEGGSKASSSVEVTMPSWVCLGYESSAGNCSANMRPHDHHLRSKILPGRRKYGSNTTQHCFRSEKHTFKQLHQEPQW